MASTSASRAIGSWTLVIICQRVRAGRARPPRPWSATRRGCRRRPAWWRPGRRRRRATIAVNRRRRRTAPGPAPGRRTAGSSGRRRGTAGSPRSARRLRPIQTPRTTASTITSTVATSVMVSVTIASFHRPSAEDDGQADRRVITQRAPAAERRRRSRRSPAPSTHHGDSASRTCSGLSSQSVNASLIASVKLSTCVDEPVGEARRPRSAIAAPMSRRSGNSAQPRRRCGRGRRDDQR